VGIIVTICYFMIAICLTITIPIGGTQPSKGSLSVHREKAAKSNGLLDMFKKSLLPNQRSNDAPSLMNAAISEKKYVPPIV